ncbi:hypothetical protein acsn021_10960 [Anaerocolumna cellulosilytica]|uniref:Uncharacterized protein n=1 Tax=Anaerocolumna cellulosilytica TaxID=433286 RepID=A0A6S6R0B5_9FIRM|nr:hypothetical protein [Anaerocolumna cellulosilytica]MBB5194583.1 hypothetical protein [Anaerocolumna cellulosilytica]BCJ93527.1 hypothetical protein acsn021_10960 [Anaerocolumna cellulosilytica]
MKVSIIAKKQQYEFDADKVKYDKANNILKIGEKYINGYVLFFIHSVSSMKYNRRFKFLSNLLIVNIDDDYCENAERIVSLSKKQYF